MNAILYAAGRGSRLGNTASKPHKILLEFNGRSLLERHVANLANLRVPHLFVVTGHAMESLTALFPDLQQRHGVRITALFNPDFTEGSVLSMRISIPALNQTAGRVLLMDGDVLYHPEILRRLIDSPHRTALLVDRGYSAADDDPVLVPLRNGRPFDFVKGWKGDADAVGESIGFFKIDAGDLPVLIRETETRSARSRADSYDDVLRVMVRQGLFDAIDVTGLPWTEIDFPHDLERARQEILPAIDRVAP